MASYVLEENLLPIYLVFSVLSPRNEAIARLKRAGWNFLIGEPAINFARELLGVDLAEMLDRPDVKAHIQETVGKIMKSIIGSHAFQQILSLYKYRL